MINLTIIIPHYNTPSLLERLLKSIPQRDDFQVIVIDDCSDTELTERHLSHIYPGILLLSTLSNGGPGIARNKALESAEGRYVIFADADDFFMPCLEAVFDEYCDKDFDTVYFNANSVDSRTYQPSARAADRNEAFASIEAKVKPGSGVNPFEYLKYRFTTPWGKLIKLDVINRHDIRFEESRISEDVLFSTKLDYHADRVWGDSRCVYCLTFRPDSLSLPINPDNSLEKLRIDCERYRFLSDHKSSATVIPSKMCLSTIAEHLHTIHRTNRPIWYRAIKICRENGIMPRDVSRLLLLQSMRFYLSRFIIKTLPKRLWRVIKNIDVVRCSVY